MTVKHCNQSKKYRYENNKNTTNSNLPNRFIEFM